MNVIDKTVEAAPSPLVPQEMENSNHWRKILNPKTVLVSFYISVATVALSPCLTLAQEFVVKNNSDTAISVAVTKRFPFVPNNNVSGGWSTQGWFTIKPNESERVYSGGNRTVYVLILKKGKIVKPSKKKRRKVTRWINQKGFGVFDYDYFKGKPDRRFGISIRGGWHGHYTQEKMKEAGFKKQDGFYEYKLTKSKFVFKVVD